MIRYRKLRWLCSGVVSVLVMASAAPAETVYRVHEFVYDSVCTSKGKGCTEDIHVKGNVDMAINYNLYRVPGPKYTEDHFEVYTTKQADDLLNTKVVELTNLITEQRKLIENLRTLLFKRIDALPLEVVTEDKVYTALKARLQTDLDKIYVGKSEP
jgi:hypothetical protein